MRFNKEMRPIVAMATICLVYIDLTFQYVVQLTEACNYLLVYEYVISADIESDSWAGMKRAIATKQLQGPDKPAPGGQSANRTLLLGGRKDGHLCVFNWNTGAVEFEIEVGIYLLVQCPTYLRTKMQIFPIGPFCNLLIRKQVLYQKKLLI